MANSNSLFNGSFLHDGKGTSGREHLRMGPSGDVRTGTTKEACSRTAEAASPGNPGTASSAAGTSRSCGHRRKKRKLWSPLSDHLSGDHGCPRNRLLSRRLWNCGNCYMEPRNKEACHRTLRNRGRHRRKLRNSKGCWIRNCKSLEPPAQEPQGTPAQELC